MIDRSAYTGCSALTRLALRRDRALVAVWVTAFAAIAAVSANATMDLYPTTGSRLAAADAINRSAALVALYGRVYDPTSLGALSMIKLGGFGSVFVAMLAVTIVVRHTRADEEAGRTELLGATAVGRLAPTAAALGVAATASMAVAVTTAIALAAVGLPLRGSIAFGAAWGGVGLVFAGVAAVCAQVGETASSATGLAAGVLAGVYLLRAVGDAATWPGIAWLRWLSPVGWAQQFRPFAGDRWWTLLLSAAAAAALGSVALRAAARRDLGAGLLRARPGPPDAGGGLRGAHGLAWRLHRTALGSWAVGLGLLGLLLGALAANVGDFLNNQTARDFVRRLGGPSALSDAFVAAELGFTALMAAAFGIRTVNRLASEERLGRADPILAGTVSRGRWLWSHLTVGALGPALLMVCVGLGAGVARAAATGDGIEVARTLVAALAQVPAIWALVTFAALADAGSPRLAPATWALLAACVVVGEVGALIGVSHWVMDASPFTHVPRLPGVGATLVPLVVLTVVAGATAGVATLLVHRRDVG